VGAGFVASLARPGGNVTGMTAINPELGAKRLQLLRELQPKAQRIAVLGNPGDSSNALDLRASQEASRQIGITLLPIDLRTVDAVDGAFEQIVRSKAGALVVFNDTTTVEARPRIVQLAAQYRIPTMYEAREWAAAGGLVAYGVTHVDLFRQSAVYIDKILRGTKPADLPVEQPTRLHLTINLSVAKALGIAIPKSVLLRADEVVE
jgi:putative ABC transport system substrate-binding protein